MNLSAYNQEQVEKINELFSLLQSIECLKYLFIGGSSSYKDVDDLSDIDVFCVIEDNKQVEFFSFLKNFLEKEKDVVYVIYDRYYEWFGDLTTIYYQHPIFFSIDVGLINEFQLSNFFVEPNAIIIKDKEKRVHKRQREIIGKENNRLQNLINLQLNQILSTIVKIRKGLHRNHLLDVSENISQLRRAYILLLRVEKSIGMANPLLGRPERDLEDYVSMDDLKDIKNSFPSYNQQAMINCTLLLFKKIKELKIFQEKKELYLTTNICINTIKSEFEIEK